MAARRSRRLRGDEPSPVPLSPERAVRGSTTTATNATRRQYGDAPAAATSPPPSPSTSPLIDSTAAAAAATAAPAASSSPLGDATLASVVAASAATSPAPVDGGGAAPVFTPSATDNRPRVSTPGSAASSVVDERLLSLPRQISKLKDNNAGLARALRTTQQELESVLASEESLRRQRDGLAAQLTDQHRQYVSQVEDLKQQLVDAKVTAKLADTRVEAARREAQDVQEELLLHKQEAALLRSRLQAMTASNVTLRSQAARPVVSVDTVLELKCQLAAVRRQLGEAKAAATDMSTGVTMACSAAMTTARNMIEQHNMLQAVHSTEETSKLEKRLELLRTQLDSEASRKADIVEQFKAAYEERRRLHNALQELKGSVRVFCRSRPVEGDTCVTIGRMEDGCPAQIFVNDGKLDRSYGFDAVFGPEVSQDGVFEEVSPLLVSLVDGYNVCIFAYGQTGSGKTYTMEGPPSGSFAASPGVSVRSVDELYRLITEREEHFEFEVNASYLEIYNDAIRDLLAGDVTAKLELRDTAAGVVLPGLTTITTHCTADVVHVIARGRANRSCGATDANAHSSRSHSVLSITVQSRNRLSGEKTRSTLHLIDLAGSERLSHSKATGDRRKEAQHINKSLSALAQTFNCLQGGYSHIPYRNSKLTHFLKDSLGGSSKTLMIVCVNPAVPFAQETACSLTFAANVNTVALGRAHKNVLPPTPGPSSAGRPASGSARRARSATPRRQSRRSPSPAASRGKSPGPRAGAGAGRGGGSSTGRGTPSSSRRDTPSRTTTPGRSRARKRLDLTADASVPPSATRRPPKSPATSRSGAAVVSKARAAAQSFTPSNVRNPFATLAKLNRTPAAAAPLPRDSMPCPGL